MIHILNWINLIYQAIRVFMEKNQILHFYQNNIIALKYLKVYIINKLYYVAKLTKLF
jgi:hypothetical protein